MRLFLALLQDTGLNDLFAALTVTYDLTLTHSASYLPLVVGLKALGVNFASFISLLFLRPAKKRELCNTHIALKRRRVHTQRLLSVSPVQCFHVFTYVEKLRDCGLLQSPAQPPDPQTTQPAVEVP